MPRHFNYALVFELPFSGAAVHIGQGLAALVGFDACLFVVQKIIQLGSVGVLQMQGLPLISGVLDTFFDFSEGLGGPLHGLV